MSREPKVVVTDASVKVPMLREIAHVHQWEQSGQMPREQLLNDLRDADALFCLLRDRIDKEALDAAPKLKIIGTMSVGHEHIDLEECKRRGIVVGYTPDVLTEATAELAVALTLATSRRIVEAVNSAKTGGWTTWTPFYMCGKALAGSTVGIYGMGKIGTSVAEKLSTFRANIVYHNRRIKPE
ncbi:D-isomer specific 2-hydroxyacid dehydrogenase, partial [Aphelenchoides avenae]